MLRIGPIYNNLIINKQLQEEEVGTIRVSNEDSANSSSMTLNFR